VNSSKTMDLQTKYPRTWLEVQIKTHQIS
jgi:hypothetical protein